jgi:hypothetical protein
MKAEERNARKGALFLQKETKGTKIGNSLPHEARTFTRLRLLLLSCRINPRGDLSIVASAKLEALRGLFSI